jgi:glycosyltransferase involved in cell wall biosynthesis
MIKLFGRIINIIRDTFNNILIMYLSRPEKQVEGYNVFGYFSKYMGQAEVARAFTDSLIKKGENIALFDFYSGTHNTIKGKPDLNYRRNYFRLFKYRNNVFFIDLKALNRLREKMPKLFQNKQNIVAFWWEFESGFEDRIPVLNEFDEVYVFSDFIKDILNSVDCKEFKVTKIDYPFFKNWVIEEEPSAVRSRYNLDEKFCFFFNFDFYSSYNRKNPEGILKALFEEFPNEKSVVFVVKTSNNKGFEEKERRFSSLVHEYGLGERVIIINDQLTRNEFMTLLNAMDCYISLHRGEGLGLGILEAFALGKTVIATNYGGNTEYMNNRLGYRVSYKLVPANDDYIVYNKVKVWAEPDNMNARKKMRKVYGNKINNEYVKT